MRLLPFLALSVAAAPAMAEVPKVVTDIPAVHALTSQIMGDLGTPEILLGQGDDPHHFQLRPSQARALSNADLVVWVGHELTPWLERALDGLRPEGETLGLLDLDTTHRQPFGGGAHGHDEDHADHDDHGDHDHDDHAKHDDHDDHDDHAKHDDHDDHDDHAKHDDHSDHDHDHDDHKAHDDHAEHDGHDEHGDHDAHDDHKDEDHADHGHDDDHEHSHDGVDPHAWLTPENATAWVNAIAAELSHLDPENAATYAANAAAAKAGVEETEAKVRSILAPVGDAPIMVFHDAYGYFATHFGVNIAGSIALGDAAAPGAKRLAEIREDLEHEGAVCVFPEAQHDPAYVQTVVAGTGTRVGAQLDPSGTALPTGPGLYDLLLTGMAQAIADCVTAQ